MLVEMFDWGEEIRTDSCADVIVLDFRVSGRVQAAIIGVKKAFSLGALVPQLLSMAFNVMEVPDIESALEATAVPYTSVRSKSFERSRMRSPSSEALSNHQVVRILSQIAKRPVVYVDVPENMARASMRELGMPASLIEGLLESRVWRTAAPGCPDSGVPLSSTTVVTL